MERSAVSVPRLDLPQEVVHILSLLNQQGFEGYVVGGCVRDSLLGETPADWDLTTNALPMEVMDVFSDYAVIPTGLQHGTVTVRVNGKSYEITTYRIDGMYSDKRRPDSVNFTTSIAEDLARRDFTMNAIAYHPKEGFVDPYNGRKSIEEQTITCVGKPEKRFGEDPLRILRAFRFASTLGFKIEHSTKEAMFRGAHELEIIASERIQTEMNKAIVGDNILESLLEYSALVFEVMPELSFMEDFPQQNPFHIYDVWTHTIHSVAAATPILEVRLAMLFHDSGKPETHSIDERGVAHFYGHARKSVRIANTIMRRLRYSNEHRVRVEHLVRRHDMILPPTTKIVKRWLNRLGEELFLNLLEVQKADAKAQNLALAEQKLENIKTLENLYSTVLKEQQCFSLSQLAVNGHDIVKAGVTEGKRVGELLKKTMDLVIEEELPNDREVLLDFLAREIAATKNT